MALDAVTLARLRALRDGQTGPEQVALTAALARLDELETRRGALTLADALDLLREEARSPSLLGRACALVLADYDLAPDPEGPRP